MKNKSTIILIALFLGLLIIAYFLIDPIGERTASYALREDKLALDSTQIRSVQITRGGRTTLIENIGGVWFVISPASEGEEKRFSADRAAVQRLLASLHNIKLVSLVSSNPQRQSIFQVDSASGSFVKVIDRKGATREFILGKMGSLFSESYVRPLASDDVYLAEGIVPWEFNKEMKDWRDKTIHTLDRDAIREITFRYPREQFSLVRDSVWTIRAEAADSTAVNGFLTSLLALRAEDFVDTTIQLASAQLQILVAVPGVTSLNFIPIPPDTSRYWITSSQTPQVFVASKWTVQPLLKRRSDFLPAK